MDPRPLWRGGAPILLASTSPTRRALLAAAGLPVEVAPSGVDERRAEAGFGAIEPRELARRLSEAKASAVARSRPDRVVIGADQVLDVDGVATPKPPDKAAAAAMIAGLAGRTHQLHSAVTVMHAGRVVAAFTDTARMTMRPLTTAEIAGYLDLAGPAALRSAGGYEVEGVGVHLFDRIEGQHTTILGLPMLPLLSALRTAGLVAI